MEVQRETPQFFSSLTRTNACRICCILPCTRSTYSNRNCVSQQQNCIIQTNHQVIPAPVTYKEIWNNASAIFASACIPLCFLLSTSAYTARAHAAPNILCTSTWAAPLPLAQPQPWPSRVPQGLPAPSPLSWLQQSLPGPGQGAMSLPCSECRKAEAAPPRGTLTASTILQDVSNCPSVGDASSQ